MEIDPTRLEEIFNAALGQADAAARAEYLDRACGDDRPLRQRVEALLAAHLTANNYLNLPGSQIGNPANQSVSEEPGSQIGPYKLLQQLGEGGMGVVYMAEQKQPVERRVALKIIKPGMDTRQVIARFEAERQALALMDHPHIAKVLDAGTTETGRPYFVMEMVRGVPITEYCDQHQLTPRQRLQLFVPVCHAVQHAHQKGIIHRDLKPSNVLVAEYDEQAVAKIIDFGIAKAIGQQLTEKTMFTQVGQLVGTIDYMSPEQAKVNQLDVDTRTDIYSLGVLLYELLTGETPFDRERLHAAALDEMLRIIREEDPPRPSTRLSSSTTLPSAAAKRRTEPKSLATLVRGELDWIVMRCLEKDRTRRYESANGLGMDIQRYLADEPVLACPPSRTYRFRKFSRRNRVALLTVAIVSVALIVGTVVSLWQAVRATRAEHLAEQRLSAETHARAAEAEQRKAAEAQRHEAENQRELAEANYQKAKAAVDRYFTLVSESTLLDVPGLQPLRKDLLEAALEFYQEAALKRTSDPAVLVDEALAHLRVGSMYFALGQVDDFIGALERTMDVVDRVGSQQSQVDDHLRRLAGWFKGSRHVWHQTDRPRDPLRAHQTVLRYLATWQRFESEYADEPGFSSDLVAGYSLMAGGLNSAGRKDEALGYFRKAHAGGEKLVAQYPQAPLYRATLADVSLGIASPYLPSRADERMSWSRRALELTEGLVAEFPDVPVYRDGLADSLRRVHDQIAKAEPRQADEMARRALDLRESLVREFPGERYFWESWRRERIAWATFEASRGNDSLANQHVQQAIETFEAQIKVRPQDRWLQVSLAIFCQTLADGLRRQGNLTALAEQLDRRALSLPIELADDFPGDRRLIMDLAEFHGSAAGRLWASGRTDEAAEHFKASVAVMEKAGRQRPEWLHDVRLFADRTTDLARIIASGARDPEPADTSRLLVRTTELLDEGLQDPVRRSCLAASIRAYCEPLSKDQPVLPEVDKLLTWSNPIVEQTIDNRPTLNKLIADHTADKWDRNRAAETQKWLAKILTWTNRPREAQEMWLRAIRSYEAIANDVSDQKIYVQYALQDYRQYLGVRVEHLVENDQPHEAVNLLRNTIDTFDKLAAEHPKSDDFNQAFQADTLGHLAWTLDQSGHAHDAAAAAKRNVDIYQALFRDHPENKEYRRGMARAAVGLARLLDRAGKLDEAEAQLRSLISIAPTQLEIYQGLADLMTKHDRIKEATAVIQSASEQASADPLSKNNLAWFLATCEREEIRDPTLAVKIAQKVVETEPQSAQYLNTLGVAQYRAEQWDESISLLAKAESLAPETSLAFNGFFLAMAHWQLGHQDEARKWYERSVEWMAKNQPKNRELVRFRIEAGELLGLMQPGDAAKDAPQVDTAKPPG